MLCFIIIKLLSKINLFCKIAMVVVWYFQEPKFDLEKWWSLSIISSASEFSNALMSICRSPSIRVILWSLPIIGPLPFSRVVSTSFTHLKEINYYECIKSIFINSAGSLREHRECTLFLCFSHFFNSVLGCYFLKLPSFFTSQVWWLFMEGKEFMHVLVVVLLRI